MNRRLPFPPAPLRRVVDDNAPRLLEAVRVELLECGHRVTPVDDPIYGYRAAKRRRCDECARMLARSTARLPGTE